MVERRALHYLKMQGNNQEMEYIIVISIINLKGWLEINGRMRQIQVLVHLQMPRIFLMGILTISHKQTLPQVFRQFLK